MYNYIMLFLSRKNSHSQIQPFSKDFRRGYKNTWINNITNYIP